MWGLRRVCLFVDFCVQRMVFDDERFFDVSAGSSEDVWL